MSGGAAGGGAVGGEAAGGGDVGGGRARAKPPVPRWRWGLWLAILALADLVFYVLLTPLWLGLRAAAWLADRRSRRRRAAL